MVMNYGREEGHSPRLQLTGCRRRRRYLVRIDGLPVWLSGTLFQTLLDLVKERLESHAGFCFEVSPVIAYRIRQAILDVVQEPRDC